MEKTHLLKGLSPSRFRVFAAGTALLTLLFAPVLYDWIRMALSEDLQSHMILMPLISGYLIWRKRQDIPQPSSSSGWIAAMYGLGALGLLLAFWQRGGGLKPQDSLAFVVGAYVLGGIGMGFACLGRATMRAIGFPMFLLIFMVPIPSGVEVALEHVLQRFSADAAHLLFWMFGETFLRDGQMFLLPGLTIHVAQECSGIRSSLVLFILSLVAAQTMLRSPWHRAALVFTVLPLGIFRNGLRVYVITALTLHVDPGIIDSVLHHRGGPLFFAVSLLPFSVILWFLWKREHRTGTSANFALVNCSRGKNLLLIMAGSLLVGGGCSRESRIERALSNAHTLLEHHKYEAAEIEYLRVLQLEPRQSAALAGLGEVYYEQGRFSLAVPVLVESVPLAPENLQARQKLGWLYLGAGRLAEAREQAGIILDEQPANREAVLIFAEASISEQQRAESRQRLQVLRERVGDQASFHLAEALFLMREGHYSDAEARSRQAIQLDPQFDAGHLILGDLLRAQGREDEGLESMERAYRLANARSFRKFRWIDYLQARGDNERARTLLVDLDKEVPAYFPILIRLARLELLDGNLAESEGWLTRSLTLDPKSAEAISVLAQLRLAQDKTDQAIKLLERLVQTAPGSAQANVELAKAHLRAGDSSSALIRLNRAIELDPRLIPPRVMRIEVSLRRGEVTGALVLIDELRRVAPDNKSADILEAEARRLAGNLDQAAAIYQELLAKEPVDAELYFRLGQIRLLQSQPAKARVLFETVLETNPNHLPSLSALADLDLHESDMSASMHRIQNRLADDPGALGPRFLLTQIYLAQERKEQAEIELNEIIKLAPTWRPPYLIMAELYVESGRVEEARTRLKRLLAERPGDERATIMLAMLDELQGDYDAAAERYEQLLGVHPDNVLAMNNLAYLYSTHLHKLDRAFALASAARKKSPRDRSIADTFGWVLLSRGEYRQALSVLREFEGELGHSPAGNYHLGLAYYKAGMASPAKRCFTAALAGGRQFLGREDAISRLLVLGVDASALLDSDVVVLKEALQKDPSDPIALVHLAAVYRSQGDVLRERGLYESALEADESSVPALIGMAELSAASADGLVRAMELARTARLLAPRDPGVARTLSKLAFRAGDPLWALSLLEECSAQSPDNLEILYDLALAYYAVGRLGDAENALQKVANRNPDGRGDARRFLDLLARHQSLGDTALARELAESSLQAQPDSVAARVVLGMIAEQDDSPAEAMICYETALKTFPTCAPAMRRIALLAAEKLNDDATAYRYGIKARNYYPDDAELSRTLGEVVFRRGDYRYARQLLAGAAAVLEEDPELLYYLGLAQVRTRDSQSGKATLTRALDLDPVHPLASQARQALGSL